MHTRYLRLFCLHFVFISHAFAGFCITEFKLLAESPKTGEQTPLTDDQADALWNAAHSAYTTVNPGGLRPKDGRSLAVPEKARVLITNVLNAKMAEEFAAAPKKGDFIAMGNAGHLNMYDNLTDIDSHPVKNKFPNGAVQDIFGLDPKEVNAIVVAHDNDKQLPKPGDALAARALQKLGGSLAAIEYAVGLHGHKSLQRLAQIIQELGKQEGWSEQEQYEYFCAYADQIGGHNFGIDLADLDAKTLQTKYPSLTEAEAKALANSFYDKLANQGGQFGPIGINQRMGFGVSDRDGHLRSALARQLIHLDRGTILDWKKVGGQNLGSMDFNPTTMEITFRATSIGALAQVKAMADMRAKDILPGKGYYVDASGKPVPVGTPGATFKQYTVEDLPSQSFFLEEGLRWQKAADKLKEDNKAENRRNAGLQDAEDKSSGKMLYERAVLYRPKNVDGSVKAEYIVRGDYTIQNGKGGKVYQLKAMRRNSPTEPWIELGTPIDAKNPMDVLGNLMILHGDLSKPL